MTEAQTTSSMVWCRMTFSRTDLEDTEKRWLLTSMSRRSRGSLRENRSAARGDLQDVDEGGEGDGDEVRGEDRDER